jgi:L-amino acid N-acyltransferase YncA
MIGPATFNTNQQVGMLVEGYQQGYQHMMPFNPPYYPELIEAAGMEKLTDLLTFRWRREQGVPAKVAAAAKRAAGISGVTLRRINLYQPAADIDLVRAVFNKSMSANWGFIPLTRAEVASMLSYCSSFADPDLLLTVLVNNQPAGILMFTPSPFPSRPGLKSVRAAILGVVPEYRRKGLDSLMMEQAIKNLLKSGYHEADLSQVHEDNNIMIKIITRIFEGDQTRRFRIFQCAL